MAEDIYKPKKCKERANHIEYRLEEGANSIPVTGGRYVVKDGRSSQLIDFIIYIC
jgi:hypothetical protein